MTTILQLEGKSMKKKRIVIAVLSAGFLVASAILLAQATGSPAMKVSGTIYGSYDPAFEGNGAWVGNAVISLGGKPALKASMADRNTSFAQNKDGSIKGTETITLTFLDGSGTLAIDARFDGIPAKSPSLFTLRESGTIARGTGKYTNAAGSVKIDGPFLFPDPDLTPGAALWIAEMKGSISGL
jgi:hypothetical protein